MPLVEGGPGAGRGGVGVDPDRGSGGAPVDRAGGEVDERGAHPPGHAQHLLVERRSPLGRHEAPLGSDRRRPVQVQPSRTHERERAGQVVDQDTDLLEVLSRRAGGEVEHGGQRRLRPVGDLGRRRRAHPLSPPPSVLPLAGQLLGRPPRHRLDGECAHRRQCRRRRRHQLDHGERVAHTQLDGGLVVQRLEVDDESQG